MSGDAVELLGVLFRHSPIPQFVSRADGSLVLANPAYARLMDTTPESVIGSGPADVTHPDDLKRLLHLGAKLLRHEIEVAELEVRVTTTKGDVRWCAATCTLAPGADGEPLFVSHLLDITERKRAEAELALSEHRFRTLADSLPLGVHRRDRAGRLVYVNPRWSEITGISESDAMGTDQLTIVHPDDRSAVLQRNLELAREGGSFHQEYRIVRPDGSIRWVSSRAVALPDAEGRQEAYVGSLEDITGLRQAEEDRSRLAAIAEKTSDLVGVIDADGWLVFANAAARAAHGLGDELDRIHASTLFTPESNELFLREVFPELQAGRSWSGELSMYSPEGRVMRVWQSIAAHHGVDGELHHISAVGRDVTAQKDLEAQLAHRATHDHLTGLPNRAHLLDLLDETVRRPGRAGGRVAVLFVDLDRFKSVNDELGHDVGDELLRAVADRFSSVLRPIDVVARLGGDEFVVLCPDIDHPERAAELAQRLIDTLTAEPLLIAGKEVQISASVGVTVAPTGEDQHPEALLREADVAMYRAKALGRDRVELFESSIHAEADATRDPGRGIGGEAPQPTTGDGAPDQVLNSSA